MKKLIALILAVLMLVSLCACGAGGGETAAEKTESGLYPAINAAIAVEVQNLLPTNGNGNPKIAFYWNVYESLFDFNENLELVPDLAKSLEIVDDTHWRVTLFEEIYDSEGNHITADDVVFSVNWLIEAGEQLNYDLFESVEAVDEYTVEYTWKSAPRSTSEVEFPLVRTFIFSEAAFDEVKFATAPVTTANYVVKEFTTGSKLVLKANPDYWADKTGEDTSMRLALHHATVDEVTYTIIQESETAKISMQTGIIDYCDYIRALSLGEFEGDDKYVVATQCSSDYAFMGFNMDPSCVLADDLNLRLAIAYALDSEAIATAMAGSFTAMKTYGTPYFGDFDPEWENEENYCNTTDIEKAKEYLADSDYAANGSPELVLICKSIEAEQNAVETIQNQLLEAGINVKLKPVDPTTYQTDTGDCANWDLIFFGNMGGKDLVSSWKLMCSDVHSARTDGENNASLSFNNDPKLFELYAAASDDATHDSEHMKAVIDYMFENAYIYPMAYELSARVYLASKIDSLYLREGNVTLCASTYAGQEPNVDSDYVGYTLGGGDASALAGTYTYSEAATFGNKDNDFTLILNEDSSYRLECNNSVGENIWTEGEATLDAAGNVCLSASPVQGDMDKLLNSGWADESNPAPVFTVNPDDGTMIPVGLDAASDEPSGEASGEASGEPMILSMLESNGFERFDFWEVNEEMGRTFKWHVMKSDGMVIVIQENELAGTDDGLLVYHYPTATEEAGLLHLSDLEEGDAELPRLGGYWNDDGTMDWQIFGMGLIYPANMEGADAYMEAVNNGEIPAKEQPVILEMLSGMGFDCFDWLEEAPVGQIPWHVLILNGDPTPEGLEAGECVIVVENSFVGTSDGLLVYHCTFIKDGPTINVSAPEESEDEMIRLGSMWNSDGSSVWTIAGAGAVTPQDAAN